MIDNTGVFNTRLGLVRLELKAYPDGLELAIWDDLKDELLSVLLGPSQVERLLEVIPIFQEKVQKGISNG